MRRRGRAVETKLGRRLYVIDRPLAAAVPERAVVSGSFSPRIAASALDPVVHVGHTWALDDPGAF